MELIACLVEILMLIALDVQMAKLVQNAQLASISMQVNAFPVQLVAVNAQTHLHAHIVRMSEHVMI